MMKRLPLVIVLSAVLTCAGMAYAADTGPSMQGVSFEVSHYPKWIYLPSKKVDGSNLYPTSGTLTVQVENAQAEPLNAIPVTFQLGPECAGHAELGPKRVETEAGVASAVLTAHDKTGFCDVVVQVGNMTEKVTFNIRERSTITGRTGSPR